MNDFFIVDAVRTVRGKADNGALRTVAPVELVRQVIAALDERHENAAHDADSLTLGCVGQVGTQGGHLALVSKLVADLPDTMTTCTLNNYCASGLTALGHAMGRLAMGQDDIALCGGVESMSSVPFMADKASFYSDPTFSSRAGYVPVAVSAELLAQVQEIERASLDLMAFRSQTRAKTYDRDEGYQASRIDIKNAAGEILLDHDEALRPTTMEKLRRLEPAFEKLNTMFESTVRSRLSDVEVIVPRQTIAHAPAMCDGAALMIVARGDALEERGLKARARVVAYAETANNSTLGLTAGLDAVDDVLSRAGWNAADVDIFEVMESFAVFPALFERDLGIDPNRVNITGGHLAKGHPMGATGAVLISTLLDILEKQNKKRGVVTIAGASGIGAAVALEIV